MMDKLHFVEMNLNAEGIHRCLLVAEENEPEITLEHLEKVLHQLMFDFK